MKLSEFNVMAVRLPLKSSFRHALAARDYSSSVIVELKADDGTRGYGEGAPRDYVTGETAASTVSVLQSIGKKLSGHSFELGERVIDGIEVLEADFAADLGAHPSAACALEMALLDLHGRLSNRPVLDFFGPRKTQTIFYSGALSDVPADRAEPILGRMKQAGFKMVKIKVSQDTDAAVGKVDLARAVLGPDVHIRVDANGAWDLPRAIETIDRLQRRGITLVEQPLAAADRDDYPELIGRIESRVQVMVDESLCSVGDARWFLENKAAACFNLKISKNGGLINTLRIYRLASAGGIACQLGCHVGETSLLTAAGQVFAGLAGDLMAYEGAYGGYLLDQDVVSDPLQFGPKGRCDLEASSWLPGFGISVDPVLLQKACGGP